MTPGDAPASKTASRGGALITGAGQRIGAALALALAKQGFSIAVHYRSSRRGADEVVNAIKADGGNAAAVKADLGKTDETAQLIAKAQDAVGPLSLLVNNASLFEADEITSFSRESWDAHMGANLYAPVKLSQDFAAEAVSGANNVIVNIVDQRVLKLTPQFFSYTLSKTALWTATQTMAQALGPQGIRVNAVAPGPVLKNPRQSDDDWRRQNEATVLGRGARPEGVVDAVSYLIDAHAVTGQLMLVDGGQHLAWQTPDVMVNE
ncbi:MAG: SDR family oxidoreductase [Pseudomonadota bacterium]